MIHQTIFHPASVTGADGWTETPTTVGVHQPPNRALPAPIFDDGNSYSPHNGAIGNWAIQKTVFSDIAGPGFMVIPPGVFPSGGGLYADDVNAQVRLNGVAVPFTGSGGNWPPQSVPVTWLAGNNTVEIEVANTVAGNTSVTGRINVQGAGIPCDCCPTGSPRCGLVPVQFDGGAAETLAVAGWVQNNIAATADGIFNTATLSGYNPSPAGTNPTPTPEITYTMTAAQSRVRGIRLWNCHGGVLNDNDGLATFTADFYAGASLLATLSCPAVNGGAPQTFTLPGTQELNGVTRVVIRNLTKLSTGTTNDPGWRELQLLELTTVFPCRRPSGALEWYAVDGELVPNADVVPCPS